jgi:hypothetical protein
MKNKECFFSSLLFLINALVAYKYKNYNYSLAFLFLVITSLIHHYYFTDLTRNIDRLAILITFYYTVTLLYDKNKNNKVNFMQNMILLIGFLLSFYLFVYGYFNDKYSFDPNHRKACMWHSLIHFICSTGLIYLIII